MRGHRHSRISVYRWSRIGRVARPHQYACNDRGGRNPKVRQTACAVAPSLSATLPKRAPARSSNADPVHRWSKIGRDARPHQYACNDRGGRNPKVRQTPAPSRHGSRLLLQTVRRLAQARLTPCIDGRKSVDSRAHTNMRMNESTGAAEILRSGKRLPRRAIALGYSPTACAGSRKHRRPRSSMVENRSRRAPAPICMQGPRRPKP